MNTTVLSGSHSCKSLSLTENNANSGTIFNTKSTLLIVDVGKARNFVLIEKNQTSTMKILGLLAIALTKVFSPKRIVREEIQQLRPHN